MKEKILTILEENVPLPDDVDSFSDEQMGLLWEALHKAAAAIAEACEAENAELEAQVAELAEQLRFVQWIDDGHGIYCPVCGNAREQGHWEKCALNKALAAVRGEEG